ncbi:MAG: ribulose-phosphate 3-epimerase [Actinobacteria bacterium HGW-Actinobacteria-9]|jgi:ribulose-phosphate 3-epimerase|nr:MAG: ribulose-phosphate 3-epimerase [Actinobacteria bacterium HGW-Actinobacteria-9]
MSDRILMAPSILSADFSRLGEDVSAIAEGGADFIHVDVMDGHFVPNLTIGPPIVKALKRVTDTPLDVHLMIENAEQTVGWYLDAGADWITVHVETCDHIHRVIQAIHAGGAKAGVSLNPGTPVESVREILGDVDMVLLMSVNPGFGGQAFIPRIVDKCRRLTEICAEENAAPLIQVDGGIDATTAPLVTAVGARCLVAGSAVFCQQDPVAAMNAIRSAGQSAI